MMEKGKQYLMQQSSLSVEDKPRRENFNLRINILRLLFTFIFAILVVRLVQVQVIDSEYYQMIASRQHEAKIPLKAKRGSIFDRSGNILASNTMFISLAADPKLIPNDRSIIAKKLSEIFHKPYNFYLEKLNANSRFVWLERLVPREILEKFQPEELKNILVLDEPKRLYHHQYTAGQLIGTTDIDNKGIAGIEQFLEQELRGVDGFVVFQRDGLGNTRPVADYPRVDPRNGSDVYLTIDVVMQSIVEEELKKGVEGSFAEGGIAILLQPFTGEILAIAQYPFANPSRFQAVQQNQQKLRAITDAFEPGSLFKLVTCSAVLEHHIVEPESKFYAENGTYTVSLPGGYSRKITDVKKHEWLTFREAMVFSSNIVMAKLSTMIGPERLFNMARAYGFGIKTGVDYPGEVKGDLKKPIEWSATTLHSISFGYEVAATPLQLALAYAVVANGGILVKPFVVQKVVNSNGEIIRKGVPEQIRRVVSPSTARLLKKFLVDVVEYGTGTQAKIKGISVAGKTGTSKKYYNGRYEEGKYTASFVGLFPADNPQVVCLVMIENPQGEFYTGGAISSPIFRKIAERIINTTTFLVHQDAQNRLGNRESLQLASPDYFDTGVLPQVKGWTVRKAIMHLATYGIRPIVYGSGVVIDQDPPAGTPTEPGMQVILKCKPLKLSDVD